MAISSEISAARTQPTPMDVRAVGQGTSSEGVKDAKGGGKRNIRTQQTCSRCGNTDHTPSFRLDVPKTWKGPSSGKYVSIFWDSTAQGQGKGGKGAGAAKTEVWREWAHVIPVSQEEGPCSGRVAHSESSHAWLEATSPLAA